MNQRRKAGRHSTRLQGSVGKGGRKLVTGQILQSREDKRELQETELSVGMMLCLGNECTL